MTRFGVCSKLGQLDVSINRPLADVQKMMIKTKHDDERGSILDSKLKSSPAIRSLISKKSTRRKAKTKKNKKEQEDQEFENKGFML